MSESKEIEKVYVEKTDCVFYKNKRECRALRQLYCKQEDCKFYKKRGNVK